MFRTKVPPSSANLLTLLRVAHVLGVVSFVLWRAVSFKWGDVGSRGVFSRRKPESFRRIRELRRTVSLSLSWVPRKSSGFHPLFKSGPIAAMQMRISSWRVCGNLGCGLISKFRPFSFSGGGVFTKTRS
jgi:hypothetical protein